MAQGYRSLLGQADSVCFVLTIPQPLVDEMLAHCLKGLPMEACGLLSGNPVTGEVDVISLSENLANSAMVYTIDPKIQLRADRAAEDRGAAILGVFHSHTHTEAYPSPTDVAQAPDPEWHYVISSLRDTSPSLRSYRIRNDEIAEEEVLIS